MPEFPVAKNAQIFLILGLFFNYVRFFAVIPVGFGTGEIPLAILTSVDFGVEMNRFQMFFHVFEVGEVAMRAVRIVPRMDMGF